jgi:DNA polymerase-3 subunit epsilon
VLAEMDRCLSPCDGSVDLDTYALMVADVRDNLLHRADEVVEAIATRMDALSAEQRYEDAGVHRDRLAAFVRAASRTQRLSALTGCPELVAARREDDGRWAVHVVRHGRLAGAGVIPVDAHAGQYVEQLRLSSETVAPGLGPTPAATAEETEKILRWLESPGIRLVHVDGEWTCPVRGASRHLAAHDAVEQSRLSLVPFDERRSLPTVHQPAR